MPTGLTKTTITEWAEFTRQAVAEDLKEIDTIIGGPGIEVEVGETKLEKRKYHKVPRVVGVWVIAGIERTERKNSFLITAEKRDEETIWGILSKFVAEGSIVYTNGGKHARNPVKNFMKSIW